MTFLLAILFAVGSLVGPPRHSHQAPPQVTPSVWNWEDPGHWQKPGAGPLAAHACQDGDNDGQAATEWKGACLGNY